MQNEYRARHHQGIPVTKRMAYNMTSPMSDARNDNAYERHSRLQSLKDKKLRVRLFTIFDLERDYQKVREVLLKYEDIGFDFCASCLHDSPPFLRVYNKIFTGRFPVDLNVSLRELKAKLIADGYRFNTKGPKSGPLCLYDDFSEPFSAKRFRFFLPLWELYQSIRLYFALRNKEEK